MLEVEYDFSTSPNQEILFRILYSLVMHKKDNGIKAKLDDYGNQSGVDKEPMLRWIVYYWAFVLFKDKNSINLSFNYMMSFSNMIPAEFKSSFLKTTIPKMIVEEWEKVN